MSTVLRPAFAYFALVFAAGFILGTLRVLVLAPRLGELAAVSLELPVMLVLSWLAAGALLRRWPLLQGGERLAMGALAFLFLMAAEVLLARLLSGQTLAAFLAQLATAPGLLGLAGQIAFALIPVIRPRP